MDGWLFFALSDCIQLEMDKRWRLKLTPCQIIAHWPRLYCKMLKSA